MFLSPNQLLMVISNSYDHYIKASCIRYTHNWFLLRRGNNVTEGKSCLRRSSQEVKQATRFSLEIQVVLVYILMILNYHTDIFSQFKIITLRSCVTRGRFFEPRTLTFIYFRTNGTTIMILFAKGVPNVVFLNQNGKNTDIFHEQVVMTAVTEGNESVPQCHKLEISSSFFPRTRYQNLNFCTGKPDI